MRKLLNAPGFFFFLCFLCSLSALGQHATPAQKAKARYIDEEVLQASIERREQNGNPTPAELEIPNEYRYYIDGLDSVDRASTQGFSLIPRGEQDMWWCVSNGTVTAYYDDYIEIEFLTNATFVDISFFDGNDELLSTKRVYVIGDPFPVSAGRMLTGSQSVHFNTIPGGLAATSAEGGTCGSQFAYQWQYSIDRVNYHDIDSAWGESYDFQKPLYRETYFRRQVVCDADTLYTAAVAVFLLPDLDPGTIADSRRRITRNVLLPQLSATAAQYGSCSSYQYQWQRSADGYAFTDIGGATGQNLALNDSLAATTYFRRRVTCDTLTGFSNLCLVRLQEDLPTAAADTNLIDSLLLAGSISLPATFHIAHDSLNGRTHLSPAQDSSLRDAAEEQQLFQMGPLFNLVDVRRADSLRLHAPALDSSGLKLMIASEDGDGLLSGEPQGISVTDSLLLALRGNGDFAQLDSLTDVPRVSLQEMLQPVESIFQAARPDSLRDYDPQLDPSLFRRSVQVNGARMVSRGDTVRYTAGFAFPNDSTTQVWWVARGGTVIAQNANPASGPVFADIQWNSSFGQTYVGLVDVQSKQYGSAEVGFVCKPCHIVPQTQTVYATQTPALLTVNNCINEENGLTYTIQWQLLDVYGSTGWTDIPGATGADYQPPAPDKPWITYHRILRYYNNGSLVEEFTSTKGHVKLYELQPGQYLAAANPVEYNTAPVVTQAQAAHGGLLLPGSAYTYTWEVSVANGAWQVIGSGPAFPAYAITQQNTRFRWTVEITGLAASYYNYPEKYWKVRSEPMKFMYFNRGADWENRNYIRENVVLTRGVSTWEAADQLSVTQKAQTTTYLDGLSRPVQVVGKATHYEDQGGSPVYEDLVKVINYEAGGDVTRSYLPYSTTENSGRYKPNAVGKQLTYYLTQFGELNAFSRVVKDGSPLNEVKEALAPGNAWGGSNVKVKQELAPYAAAEGVRRFTIGYGNDDRPVDRGTYPALFLQKSVSYDEASKKVISYTDRGGQVVLKKVQLDDNAAANTHNGWLCTYYVYNDLGQLRCTITPKAVKAIDGGWTVTQAIADGLCYFYNYDAYGRVVYKKSPDKGRERMIYDRRDRLVFVQDRKLYGLDDQYLVTLYDALDRPVMTGLYGPSPNGFDDFAQQAQDAAGSLTVTLSEGGTFTLWDSPLSATDITSSRFVPLSFNYYDDYGFGGAKTFAAGELTDLSYKNAGATGNVESAALSKRTAGLLTGTKTGVIGQTFLNPVTQFLSGTVFYDEEGRAIQQQADNIKGGVETASTQYHFDGRVLSTRQTHNATGTSYTGFALLTKYKYDRIGRLTGIGKKINDATRSYAAAATVATAEEDADAGYKLLADYRYNGLNQRVKKVLAPAWNSGQGLETIDYSYNIRGWLTGINKDYALAEYLGSQWDHFFGMYIGYDNSDSRFQRPRYNGQITGVQWKSGGDNTPRRFDYDYDNAGRLQEAMFTQKGGSAEAWSRAKTDFSTKDISYDENGNLLTLTHMGIIPTATAPVKVDQLSYTYLLHSNRLKSVTDAGTAGSSNGKLGDLADNPGQTGDDYAYDVNGNLVQDGNRRIDDIDYNYLDKPASFTVKPRSGTGANSTILYWYTAGGEKLKKQVTETVTIGGSSQVKVTTTTYIGAFVYEQVTLGGTAQPEVLGQIGHEEGRVRVITPVGSAASQANYIGGGVPLPGGLQGVFDYFIRDNLSNIRAVITEEVNQAAGVCTMEDADAAVKDQEEATFGHPTGNEVSGTRVANDATVGWDANSSARVSKLVATSATAVGPNVLLKVMAGDVIAARVNYFYQNSTTSNLGDNLAALASSLVSSLSAGAGGGLPQQEAAVIGSNMSGLPGTDPLQTFFSNQTQVSGAPRAGLTYVFFDEQFRFVGATSGSLPVEASGDNGSAMRELVSPTIKAVQNGYVFVYVSNSSSEPVYFDNLSVTHARSPLIEENHYYAFGLKIASISSKAVASTLNPNATSYGYQGAYSEELNDLELNYNEFDLRLYDPQIGRWNSVDPYDEFPSPYTGMGNDPVSNVDPTGGFVYKPEIFRSLLTGGSGAISASSLAATVSGAMSAAGQGLAMLAVFGSNMLSASGSIAADLLSNTQADGGASTPKPDNEYEIVRDNSTGRTTITKISGKGGEQTDYIIYKSKSCLMCLPQVTGSEVVNVKFVTGAPQVPASMERVPGFVVWHPSADVALGDDLVGQGFAMWAMGKPIQAAFKGIGVAWRGAGTFFSRGTTFYRAVSYAEYAAIETNGGLAFKGGTELFVSSSASYSRAYLQKPGYDVLVKFTMKPGAWKYFEEVGVMHRTAAGSRGWAARGNLLWKSEQGVMNLGVQQNTHMFNPWIQSFKLIK